MKHDEIPNLAITNKWPRGIPADKMPSRARWAGPALALTISAVLAGCGGGSMFGSSSTPSASGTPTSSSGSSSWGDRFGQLFGSKSQAVGEAAPPPQADEPTCPQVAIRFGASTYAVGLPGKEASGNDLRYQATIVRTARDCNLQGGQIKARVGIQGRVIVGPAGAPSSVDIPMRIAVVKEGLSPKVIFSNAYRTGVEIASDASYVDFSYVAEDIVYPVPQGPEGDSYVFYVGFDPAGAKPEPRARSKSRGAKS